MYRKYHEVWSTHAAKYGAKTALLYQVGGFFEIYDTENLATGTTQANIREVAELCQLSLTQHMVDDAGSQLQTLFGGFPVDAVGKFEKILVSAGWTVVVVVQRKGLTGAVEDRVVDHISSPGCYVDSSVKERRLVGCVLESMSDGPAALRRLHWAVAALDIATGGIWFAEGAGSGNPDRLHQFLCMHPPSELVIWSDGLPAAAGVSESLKSACAATHMRCLSPASVAIEEATLRRFWPISIKVHMPQARRALAALLDFAADHMPSSLKNLKAPDAWVPDGEVRLGNAALEQLGLMSLRGDGKQCLLDLMDKCRSVAGRRLMRARLLRPISVVRELEDRLDRIEAAAERDAVSTERGLRGLYDISRLWRRLELGTATMNDMACLLRSYESAVALGMEQSPFLSWLFARWDTAATVELARVGGTPVTGLPFIAGALPTLEAVFAEGVAIREEAQALCKSWSSVRSGKVENLYLDDAEGGGFRVTGTKRRINAVLTVLRDDGDESAKITQFKTSAVLETAGLDAISERHRTWMRRWSPMWFSAWAAEIAEIVVRGSQASAATEAWCADLDVSWTMSRLAAEWLWKRPVLVADAAEAFIEVTRLRHPILERLQIGGNPYVAHSVALSSRAEDAVATSRRGLLLYGMNASGKSSLMKAIGLCTLLAQCGFPVPAATCRIAPFTAIFTRILGNDNLWAGLSSFAVEMTEFREILRFADERSLVLGDELCSGTESLSATALVAAGVESLATRGTKFVFATHLHELATLPDIAGLSAVNTVKAVHLKVHYDAAADVLIYDRQLAAGSGSALYGLEVCRALDLPVGYLDRATAIRKSLSGWVAPQQTSYSAAAVLDRCAVCGSTNSLEAHHIVHQALAGLDIDIHATSNLACLCATCHDDHHGGRLVIRGWEETSAGRRLIWNRPISAGLSEEVTAWIREQKLLKIPVATIQRMVKQVFVLEVTTAQIKRVSK